ncbi:hypothetical protein B0H16DRAFT_1310771, partial [Mycena metata]
MAYYGTVEQQGRLTLHLHLLLWVRMAMSPQEIRDRIMRPDSAFQQKLVQYLESCHRAEFIGSTLDDVSAEVNIDVRAEAKWEGLRDYMPPTHTLPAPPPALCSDKGCNANCIECKSFLDWCTNFDQTTNDIVLRTNVHSHLYSIEDEKQRPSKKITERKGCMTKNNVCKARFPRSVFQATEVAADGHIDMKHVEPMVNTFNPVLSYLSRCNTDVTSLMSGTAVKAVIAYVSDYISKVSLKSYQLFASVFQAFDSGDGYTNQENMFNDQSKHLMRRMVNSLSTKMEIGSPMASMYLLGDPDHYSSHVFAPFAWRSYAYFVRKFWHHDDIAEDDHRVLDEKVELTTDQGNLVASSAVDDYRYRPIVFENVTLYEWVQCSAKKRRTKKEQADFLAELEAESKYRIPSHKNQFQHYIMTSSDDSDADYSDNYNSDEDVSDEQDILSCSDWDTDDDDETVYIKQAKIDKRRRIPNHPFLKDHPKFKTHCVACDFSKLDSVIPNFIGGALPRADKGDRGFYCLTMLTMFKPWRSPAQLKSSDESWDQAYASFNFTDRQLELIRNFNMRYECNDARDDHYAQMKKQSENVTGDIPKSFGSHLGLKADVLEDMDPEMYNVNPDDCDSDDEDVFVGPRSRRLKKQEDDMVSLLRSCGWMKGDYTVDMPCDNIFDRVFPPYYNRASWSTIVKGERQKFTANKLSNLPPADSRSGNEIGNWDQVKVLPPAYLFNIPADIAMASTDIQSAIIRDFGLNEEQARAFTLVAQHAS